MKQKNVIKIECYAIWMLFLFFIPSITGDETADNVTLDSTPIILINESFESGPTPVGWTNTGWLWDYYGSPHNGSHWIYSWAAGDTLTSPAYAFQLNTTFRFWKAAENSDNPMDLEVYVNGTLVWSEYGYTHEDYQEVVIDLSGFTGSHSIAITAMTSGFYGQCVDDLLLVTYENQPPTISNEYPVDSETMVERPPVRLSAQINDNEGDLMNLFIRWRSHQGTCITLISFNDVGNKTYQHTPTGNDWIWGNTTFTWSMNVTDGISWTNETYTFTTGGSRYDVNNNGVVNFQDAGIVWTHRTSIVPYDGLYDVNQDGQVNFMDAGLTWVNRD